MYNFFKYQENVKQQQNQRKKEQQYSEWMLKNEGNQISKIDLKEEAKEKSIFRLQDWIADQMENGIDQHVEDDHYKQWRFIKQFRDVEYQQRFKGYKSFRYKQHCDVGNISSRRKRQQSQGGSQKNKSLSARKQKLSESDHVLKLQENRSLRSQGPFNPRISFRPVSLNNQKEKLRPQMRFKSTTDKERMNQTHHTFDDKFKSLYSITKSKIGVPHKVQGSKTSRDISTKKSRYDSDLWAPSSSRLIPVSKTDQQVNIPEEEDDRLKPAVLKEFVLPNTVMGTANPNRPLRKTYFKLAKAMELQGCTKIKTVLDSSQYNRRKDMSNINMNVTCENYLKPPIL